MNQDEPVINIQETNNEMSDHSDIAENDDENRALIPGKYKKSHFIVCILSLHSALKLEKSAISKVQKHIIYIFKNGKKSIFVPEKTPKIAFLVVLNFFQVQKLIFCHFSKCK